MVQTPSAYIKGHARARHYDQAAADNYVRHTTMGDPVLDPVMEELASLPISELHRFIMAGIEQREEILRQAPQVLRDFFNNFEEPAWLDYEAFSPGIRAFHLNAEGILVAFVVGALVEGFSTLIAKSFRITGRVASTTRRLRQNNRQLVEIFFPGGLQRNGDGWKLSTRIRFVHARIRNLLTKSDEWHYESWGTPLSAAHMGFAISVFSKRLLDYAQMVGVRFSDEEKESILSVWRYAGYLMGIPETILYTNGAEADNIYRISKLCEPAPDADSTSMANALIQAIPGVVDIKSPDERARLVSLAYRLSRAVLGNRLADQYQYPRTSTVATLVSYRLKQRLKRLLKSKSSVASGNFTQLLQISQYDKEGLSYSMPDHVDNSKSIEW